MPTSDSTSTGRYVITVVCIAIAVCIAVLLLNLVDRSGLTTPPVPRTDVVGQVLADEAVDAYIVSEWRRGVFLDDLHRREAEEAERRKQEEAARAAERRAAERRATTTTAARAKVRAATPSTGRCGGDLPPCWVMQRESGGNIHAYNRTGCSGRGCRGKWQCDPRTCSGTGTEAEQDAEARALWNGGRGCAHWTACG